MLPGGEKPTVVNRGKREGGKRRGGEGRTDDHVATVDKSPTELVSDSGNRVKENFADQDEDWMYDPSTCTQPTRPEKATFQRRKRGRKNESREKETLSTHDPLQSKSKRKRKEKEKNRPEDRPLPSTHSQFSVPRLPKSAMSFSPSPTPTSCIVTRLALLALVFFAPDTPLCPLPPTLIRTELGTLPSSRDGTLGMWD